MFNVLCNGKEMFYHQKCVTIIVGVRDYAICVYVIFMYNHMAS